MATAESFEAIIGRTFSIENVSALRMQMEHPYIAEDSALYNVGLALEVAFQNRGDLISAPIDPRDEVCIIDGEEWELTDKRRALFDTMCRDIVDDIGCNPNPETRLDIFSSNVKSAHANIKEALKWREILPDEAEILRELASHIGDLCEFDADKHFQTV